MDVYDAIRDRFSVRAYEDRDIEDDKLRRVLDAGRLAPSARNLQNWKFVVVRDRPTRQKLSEASEQPFIGQAPVVVAVVTLVPDSTMYCGVPTGPVDCAIAIDHMALAAVAEGLGTCWIGHFDQEKCCDILGVPDSARIIELLLMGYPAASPGAKNRKNLDEVVCWERFS